MVLFSGASNDSSKIRAADVLRRIRPGSTSHTAAHSWPQVGGFPNGSSLGFADGSLQTALVQVHERAVNNALYANSPDAPEWMKADMPSAEVLAEHPHVADRYADVLPVVR